jgi:hypothetical protein
VRQRHECRLTARRVGDPETFLLQQRTKTGAEQLVVVDDKYSESVVRAHRPHCSEYRRIVVVKPRRSVA